MEISSLGCWEQTSGQTPYDAQMRVCSSMCTHIRSIVFVKKGKVMGRKKLTSGEGASVSPALIERIRNLATRIWNDRQSQMARDLDIDQASISRVLAGKQQPGAKLLEKLATWPG